MSTLLLIEGLPGSGTTTLAKTYVPKGYVHLEPDMYFYKDGIYAFEPAKYKEARKWCRDSAYEALSAGRDVVIAGWFLSKCEVEPYRRLASLFKANLEIIVLTTQFESPHIKNKAMFEKIKSHWRPVV